MYTIYMKTFPYTTCTNHRFCHFHNTFQKDPTILGISAKETPHISRPSIQQKQGKLRKINSNHS